MNKIKTNIKKRTYRKPELEKVQLAIDEAVLVFCKTTASLTPFQGQGCNPSNQHCVDRGS